MKRIAFYLMVIVLSAVTFTACSPDSEFEETLLIGKWKSNISPTTEYYRYDAMGTGVTWDTGEDVTEAEGQAFTWMLDQDDLTQIHIIEVGNGNSVTKKYTVTELTATTLKYKDSSKNYSFTKVK
jgi:hypothetical protein